MRKTDIGCTNACAPVTLQSTKGPREMTSSGGKAPRSGDIEPGTSFDGRYRILGLLGRGSSGTVYHAIDETVRGGAGRERPSENLDDVAIKVLHPGLIDPLHSYGFVIEFTLLARLRHPNLVRVERFATSSEGQRYLVAERVDGPNLRTATREGPPSDLLWLAYEILQALEHLHRHGYVHQDIKPSNILVGGMLHSHALRPVRQWTPKVTDLGTAALRGSDPRGIIRGTLAYLAPERLAGAKADVRSDLWALGMTLHSCATGRLPTRADSPAQVSEILRRAPIAPLRDFRPDAPPELERLVHRMLAANPRERYRDATDALSDLVRFLAPEPLRRKPEARIEAMIGDPPLVGRDDVVAGAGAVLAGRHRFAPRALVLIGPAGSGRTRILREAALRAQLLGARTVDIEAGVGLHPWLSGLAQLSDPGRGQDALHVQSVERVAAALVEMLARNPAVVVCDDLDRRDRIAKDVIERVAPALASAAIPHTAGLVISVDAAFHRASPFEDPTGIVYRRLAPLTDADVAKMCSSILGQGAPDAVCHAVAQVAGGSPSLATEALRELLLRGALRQVGGVWQIEAGPSGLTATHALSDRRLANLGSEARLVLETLSLFGPAGVGVALDVALEAAELSSPRLAAAIEELSTAQLVVLSAGVGRTVSLLAHTSEAVRAACAAAVGAKRRAGIHTRAYRALLDRGASAASLCHHALGAGLPREALSHASRAAEEALERGDGLSALSAAEIVAKAARESLPVAGRTALLLRARALLLLGRFSEAGEAAREVLIQDATNEEAALVRAKAAVRAGDAKRAAHIVEELAALQAKEEVTGAKRREVAILRFEAAQLSSRPRDAIALGERLLAGEEWDRPEGASADSARSLCLDQARIHFAIGQVGLSLGDADRARIAFTSALRLNESIGDDVGIANAHCMLAALADMEADTSACLENVTKGLEHAQRAGANSVVARLLNIRGISLLWSARFAEAAEALEEAEIRGRLSGYDRVVSAVTGNRVQLYRRQGLYGQAFEAAVRSLRVKRRLGDRMGALFTLINLSTLYIELGDLSVARALVRRTRKRAAALGQENVHCMSLLNTSWAALASGDIAGGRAALQELRRSHPPGIAGRNAAEFEIMQAKAAAGEGRSEDALAILNAAHVAARSSGDTHDLIRVELECADLLGEQGHDALWNAAELAFRVGARLLGWRAHARLGQLLAGRGEHIEAHRKLRRAGELLWEVLADLPPRHQQRYLRTPAVRPHVEAILGAAPDAIRPSADSTLVDDDPTYLEPVTVLSEPD